MTSDFISHPPHCTKQAAIRELGENKRPDENINDTIKGRPIKHIMIFIRNMLAKQQRHTGRQEHVRMQAHTHAHKGRWWW